MNSTAGLTKSSLTALDDLHGEKLHAWHRERLAVIYILSRDFVGHMLTLYATFARLYIAQRNWRWALQQPLKRWQKKRHLCECFLANAIKITR